MIERQESARICDDEKRDSLSKHYVLALLYQVDSLTDVNLRLFVNRLEINLINLILDGI